MLTKSATLKCGGDMSSILSVNNTYDSMLALRMTGLMRGLV